MSESNRELEAMFVSELGVEQSIAELLVRNKITSVEEVAYIPISELLSDLGLSEAKILKLRNRAKDQLMSRAIGEQSDL